MPAQYEAIRDFYIRKGLQESAAKTKAAKIYNGIRSQDQPPVTRKPDTRYNDDKEE